MNTVTMRVGDYTMQQLQHPQGTDSHFYFLHPDNTRLEGMKNAVNVHEDVLRVLEKEEFVPAGRTCKCVRWKIPVGSTLKRLSEPLVGIKPKANLQTVVGETGKDWIKDPTLTKIHTRLRDHGAYVAPLQMGTFIHIRLPEWMLQDLNTDTAPELERRLRLATELLKTGKIG